MPRSHSVLLDDHSAQFVDRKVDSGRFRSDDAVVRAGLRLLEEHQAKLQALEEALVFGERSGEPRAFDDEAFRRRMREQNGARPA